MFKKIMAGICLAALVLPVFSGDVKPAVKQAKNKTIMLYHHQRRTPGCWTC